MSVANMETQLDYAFHSLGKKVQARITDQKLGCVNIRALKYDARTEFILRAQHVTLAWETTLYSLKCHQQEVQLATDWDKHACFKELPVWLNADKTISRFTLLGAGIETAPEQFTTRELHHRPPQENGWHSHYGCRF